MAKGYEIRINSIQDSKATVQQVLRIQERAESLGCTHIELHVAQEIEYAAKQILPGIFRFKTIWKTIRTQPDNVLCVLPSFVNYQKLVKEPPKAVLPAKKVGWPKGKPRKPVESQPPQQAAA